MELPRVLVVDDDEAVRYAVCLALSVIGCATDPASGPCEALERFRPGRYRAVVTDVTMPVMSGLELARRLRTLEPGLPVMIFSGEYARGEIEGHPITPKPDIDALTRLVARALAHP
jgi:CheY-like chemotaxis protein